MRISLADSQMIGFKRWSDAQRERECGFAEIDAYPEPAKQRVFAPATMIPAMLQNEPESNDGCAIEAFAQALYEAEDPGRVAWAKRTTIVREAWLLRARRQLKTAPQTSGGTDERKPT